MKNTAIDNHNSETIICESWQKYTVFKAQYFRFNNKNIDRLKKDKIKIYLKQSKKNLKNATMTVVSSAIKKTNPEMVENLIKIVKNFK